MKKVEYNHNKSLLGLFLFILIISTIDIVTADCYLWAISASNEPIANVTVTYRNGTDNVTLSINNTAASGRSTHIGNCVNISIKTEYPSSGYSATITNASAISEAHINDWVTARIQLKNTLGQYLEGQDCSVSIYKVNTSDLIHDYDTLCTIGEPYVDDSGNWVSPTDCKFTDSLGWYYFKGEITEALGYEYNNYYDITFVCNAQSSTVTFLTTLDKQPDLNKAEDFIQKQGGYIILGILGSIIILALIMIIVLIYYHAKKK